MLSVPQSTKAIDSGYWPLLSFIWRSTKRSTTTLAQSIAAEVGMACGSSACIFLPVGRTAGLRIGSPPGPGVMNSPFRPERREPISLSATTCLRQNSLYEKTGASSSSDTSKSSSFNALRIGDPPENKFWRLPMISLTSWIRPLASVDRSTEARTAARTPILICSASVTSASTPASLFRYTSSMSRPRDLASRRGSPGILSSGRSIDTMLTSVAIASSAVGGTPTV
mmetsp:Transcript_125864/g.228399  ORF Transcript_125864/g.228399 Transcript_125864/m.228399 type:complete len:226 (-) Transcript_125864:968-1645(-)